MPDRSRRRARPTAASASSLAVAGRGGHGARSSPTAGENAERVTGHESKKARRTGGKPAFTRESAGDENRATRHLGVDSFGGLGSRRGGSCPVGRPVTVAEGGQTSADEGGDAR